MKEMVPCPVVKDW